MLLAFTVISAKEFKVAGVIQGISMNTENPEPFPAGIVYDPRTRSVVLNGRTGHVQFFDVHNTKLLYSVSEAVLCYVTLRSQ